MGDSKVKVAVRVRPMNRRELDLHTKCVVDVDANKVILHPVNTNLSKGDARCSEAAGERFAARAPGFYLSSLGKSAGNLQSFCRQQSLDQK
ncbi:kinesin-like protein KIF13B isoform X2 [Hirundo rustica]|uniref:kinesin-like protein KIF13B isoform X2 n=1 Tax=Hirundo rustica TaxID=43150 RepID=UPI001A93EF14|nr:kinesin-like protein KIF13B isoform X2 [Hirundo rustica]